LRVVSAQGSLTEIAWRLGAQASLVGVDATSTFPPQARQLPQVGYMRTLSAEGILSLRPTTLLGTDEIGPPAVLQQLRSAGLTVWLARADHTPDELMRKVALVGEALDCQGRAKALQAELQQALQSGQALRARSQQALKQCRAVFLMAHGSRPQLAGQGTAAHAMLQLIGAHNPLGEQVQGYRPLSAEALVQARPDVIVTSHESMQTLGGEEALWALPGMYLTPAGRHRRMMSMDAMALLGFGPRLPEVLNQLHQGLLA
jgi:iron complex transport system substrate-binding protein